MEVQAANSSGSFPVQAQSHSSGLFYLFKQCVTNPGTAFRKWRFGKKIEDFSRSVQEADAGGKRTVFLHALGSVDYHVLRPELRKLFNELPVKEQDSYLQEAVLEGFSNNNPELLNRCLHLLDFEGMEKLLAEARGKIKAFDTCFKNRMRFLQVQQDASESHPVPSELKRTIPYISNLFISFINTLIYSTSILELGKHPQSAWDANFQLEVYYKIAAIPVTLFFALQGYITNPFLIGAAFSGTMLAILSFLYAYFRWLQPAPNYLSDTIENLTEKVERPVAGRDAEIDTIIYSLRQAEKLRQFPILVGKTGVGKNQTIDGLAYALKTDPARARELSGKTVFLINTADLLAKNSFTGKSPLDEIRQRIGRHGKDVVLVFNEAHAMMEKADLLEKMKTSLDPSAKLPYCVFITSDDKYGKIKAEPSLKSRLKPVEIKPMGDSQTLKVLKSILRRSPEVAATKDELQAIIDDSKTPDAVQPAPAIAVLYQKLDRIADTLLGTQLETALRQLKTELGQLNDALPEEPDGDALSTPGIEQLLNERDAIQEKIKKAEEAIKTHLSIVEEFNKLKALGKQAKKRLSSLVGQIQKNPIASQLKLDYLFTEFFLLPAKERAIADFARRHNFTVKLSG